MSPRATLEILMPRHRHTQERRESVHINTQKRFNTPPRAVEHIDALFVGNASMLMDKKHTHIQEIETHKRDMRLSHTHVRYET